MAVDPRFPQGNTVQIIPGQVQQQLAGFYPCDNNTFEAGGLSVVQGYNLPAASVGLAGNTQKLTPQQPAAALGGIPTNFGLGGPNPNVLPTQATAGVGNNASSSGEGNSSAQGAAGAPQGLFTSMGANSTGLLGHGQLATANVAV